MGSCKAFQSVIRALPQRFSGWHSTLSDAWSLLGAGFDMALDRSPTARPTAGADGTHQDHAIMKPEMVQQLVMSVACLITVRAKPG